MIKQDTLREILDLDRRIERLGRQLDKETQGYPSADSALSYARRYVVGRSKDRIALLDLHPSDLRSAVWNVLVGLAKTYTPEPTTGSATWGELGGHLLYYLRHQRNGILIVQPSPSEMEGTLVTLTFSVQGRKILVSHVFSWWDVNETNHEEPLVHTDQHWRPATAWLPSRSYRETIFVDVQPL